MEQVNNAVGTLLQAAAMQGSVPQGSKSEGTSDDFQKLLDRKVKSNKTENQTKDQPKAETKPAKKQKADTAENEQEKPIELANCAMQVCLAPVDEETLSQYPAEWLPQTQEGEPIVCIGVHTDKHGEQIPTLVSAHTAEARGFKVVTPETPDSAPL